VKTLQQQIERLQRQIQDRDEEIKVYQAEKEVSLENNKVLLGELKKANPPQTWAST
jgi:hypothetical protein